MMKRRVGEVCWLPWTVIIAGVRFTGAPHRPLAHSNLLIYIDLLLVLHSTIPSYYKEYQGDERAERSRRTEGGGRRGGAERKVKKRRSGIRRERKGRKRRWLN